MEGRLLPLTEQIGLPKTSLHFYLLLSLHPAPFKFLALGLKVWWSLMLNTSAHKCSRTICYTRHKPSAQSPRFVLSPAHSRENPGIRWRLTQGSSSLSIPPLEGRMGRKIFHKDQDHRTTPPREKSGVLGCSRCGRARIWLPRQKQDGLYGWIEDVGLAVQQLWWCQSYNTGVISWGHSTKGKRHKGTLFPFRKPIHRISQGSRHCVCMLPTKLAQLPFIPQIHSKSKWSSLLCCLPGSLTK